MRIIKDSLWVLPLSLFIVLVNTTDSVFAKIGLGLTAIILIINSVTTIIRWSKQRKG